MTADAIADGPEPEDDETEQPPVHARLGEYRLVQRLGEGGMGVVHLALDRHGRAVAIKVLRQHIAHDPDARARLTREVKSLSRITSPRVAPIIDADVDGPTPYIVTRYVPGPSLDDHVAERGLLPPADLHRVASGLAEALDAIHSAGVVHRDVKPGNVLLVDGDPVLIDFGIAHVADDIRLTMTGLVMGTPGYLAPEVVGGDDVTQATDWWGWAATTAFAASGTPPFGTGPMSAVLARVSAGDPDLEAVDPRIEPLLYAALSPNPSDRPHHDEVVAALERYAHGAPVTEAIQVRRVRPADPAALRSADHGPAAAPPPPSRPAGRAGDRRGRCGRSRVRPGTQVPAALRRPAPSPGPDAVAPPAADGHHRPRGRPARVGAGPPGEPAVAAAPAPGATCAAAAAARPRPAPGQPGPPVPDSESDWDAARLGHGPWGDPRIGRPSRSGTLLALLAVLAAVSARAPMVAVLGLLAWVTLARTADRSVTSLVMRRHERGARGSDVAVAVATSPWHLVLGLVGAAATLVLPLFVGVCAMFASALVLTAVRGTDVRTDDVLPLVVAGVFAGLTAWWGPGGASLRRGSRSIVRGLTPGEAAGQVAAGILLVVAAVVLAMTVTGDGPTWWPRTTAPGWASQVVPTL